MLAILNNKNLPDKHRKWAARTAIPYCHPKFRSTLRAVAAGAVDVQVRYVTNEEALLKIDRDAQAVIGNLRPLDTPFGRLVATEFETDAIADEMNSRSKEPDHIQPMDVIDRMEAEWFNMDSPGAAHEPALPPQMSSPAPIPAPMPTPPPPPAPASRPNGAPHEPRPLNRVNGNGTSHAELVNGGSRPPPRGNGAVVRRSDEEIRNIRGQPRLINGYPATHPIHGVV